MDYKELIITLETHRDEARAAKMKSYLKDHFECYGIDSKRRRELSREYIHHYKGASFEQVKDQIRRLWASSIRDCQYVAMDLFSKHEKKIGEEDLEFIRDLITTKSWWDTVDWLASHALGTYLLLYPANRYDIIEDWMASGQMWLQRSCIIHQLFYRQKTDKDLLAALILEMVGSKEFFINKACGWALRQYSKSNSQWVEKFINENRQNLNNLTIKEGMKWIEKQK